MRLPSDFWTQIPMDCIPVLDTLRNTIIESRPPRPPEDGKKPRSPAMPKWHFKLPGYGPPLPGTIIHLQPKIKPFNGFEGTAEISMDEVGTSYLMFRIIISDDGEWFFKPWSWRSPHENCCWKPQIYADQAIAMRARTLTEIETCFHTLNVGMMLSPSCLLCGRALSDPVSQARWVGPECWGSASAIMPFIMYLTGESPDLYWE